MLLAMLFVLVQYASILHAAEHPFHAQDASCEIFHAIEKSKSVLADIAQSLYTTGYADLNKVNADCPVISETVHSYRSRAPPVLTLA